MARSTQVKRARFVVSGITLNSTNTGVPAKEWFQPPGSTDTEDRTDLIERIESYAWHIEHGLTPLCSLVELLAEVADQLRADAHFAPEYEEACDRLARCEVASDITPIVRATFAENKGKSELTDEYLVEEISKAVVIYINDGIAPADTEVP